MGFITHAYRLFFILGLNKVQVTIQVPYARHHNPLLIRNRSGILTIHKGRIFGKNFLEKTFLTFEKWVKSIQTAGYNGANTVCTEVVKIIAR